MHKTLLIRICISAIIIFASVFFLFGPAGTSKETVLFVVPQKAEQFDVAEELGKQGLVRSGWLARLIFSGKTVEPGGYRLTKFMWLLDVSSVLQNKPSLVWVTISGCLRREQIGELIGKKLGWDQAKQDEWNGAYKSFGPEYAEGVYYPDTYLIPVEETGAQVAKRFIDHFNEKFAPYAQKFIDANIRWVTGLKIASLIEREAGGQEDMKLISGIIWNRLNTGMRLQIDATMQYTKGKRTDGSWWGNIDLSEINSDSPYNTYLYKGLPPTPICSPSITSIEAVLNPEETDCVYYLHDKTKQIHCAKTYAEHKENIKLYLQ